MASARKPAAIASVRKTARPISALERGELKANLDLIRRHIRGYTASEGWGVKDLVFKTVAQIRSLNKKAAKLRELLSQPHEVISAPTQKARRSLVQFTRQKLRKAKHFIVHKPADNFKVSIKHGRIVIRGKYRNKVVVETSYYLFPRAVRHPDDAERMLRDMLADGMPAGFYVMLTGAHGDTGEPVERDQLLSRLRMYINAYQEASVTRYDVQGREVGQQRIDQQFAQSVIGFRHMSTTLAGAEIQMRAEDIRGQRAREYAKKSRIENMSAEEREEYFGPRKAEAKRQRRRKAAKKSARTRRRNKKAKAKGHQ